MSYPYFILTSDDSDAGTVQSSNFLCPHDDDSFKLATSDNPVNVSIRVGDTITYYHAVRRYGLVSSTVKAVNPSKDIPLVLESGAILDKDTIVSCGEKSNNKFFQIRQYNLEKGCGATTSLTDVYSKNGQRARSNLQSTMMNYCRRHGIDQSLANCDHLKPRRLQSKKNDVAKPLSPIQDDDDKVSLDSACERDWEEKFGEKDTEEEWQRRMSNDKPMGESGITYGEHWREKYRRKKFAEWRSNWHKKRAAMDAAKEPSSNSKQSLSLNDQPSTPTCPKECVPKFSPHLSFSSSLDKAKMTPISRQPSLLRNNQLYPSPPNHTTKNTVSIPIVLSKFLTLHLVCVS